MKKCKWYQFHKWAYVKDSYKERFLGEECEVFYDSYRICQKCGKTQYYTLTGYAEMGWITLDECKSKVLKSKIEPVMENDKLVYYFK